MLRLLMFFGFMLFGAAPAVAQLTMAPDNARRFTLLSAAGPHGHAAWRTTPDGVRWSRSNMVLRGLA